jgi:UDP-glucose 4-epimerase
MVDMGERWLITGGCGFIGTGLIRTILEEQPDARIRVLDNLSVGTREDLGRITESAERGARSAEAGWLRPDDRDPTRESQEKPDIRGTKSETISKFEGSNGQKGDSIGDCLGDSGFGNSNLFRASDFGIRASDKRVALIVGDIRDPYTCMACAHHMDVIVHLAANTGVGPSVEDPVGDMESNVRGTLNMLEAARKQGVKRFVFASSGAPVGEVAPPIHEELAARPVSPYGASKLAGEGYCSAYFQSFGVETVALRFGNVYGPGSANKNSVVAKFIKHILAGEPLPIYGDGRQTRDFIYIRDILQAIMLSAGRPGIGGEVFQIATHREHTVGEVAEALNRLAVKYMSRRSEIVYEQERTGDVKRNFSDISKARRVLGFEPIWDLGRGLEETFLWFLEEEQGVKPSTAK